MWLRGLPFPPSTNSLFRSGIINGRVMRFKTADYRRFEREIKTALQIQKIKTIKEQKLSAHLYFYAPKLIWFTKSGSPRKIDLDNRIKGIIDQLFDYLGLDDKFVFEIHAFKCVAESKRVDVYLSSHLNNTVLVPKVSI